MTRQFWIFALTSAFWFAPGGGINSVRIDAQTHPLRLVQTIPLPGVHGRIDHMDVDTKGQRLFVAGLENGSLEVVDLRAGKSLRSIPGFKKPQGIAFVRALNKVFVASGDDEKLRVFRGDTLALLDTIALDIGPNRGNVVESIDRKTGAVTKWPLAGLRGNYAMALNEADHRLFTVTRKTPMLVVLDTTTGKEVARLRAAGECDDVYFDEARKRIYVIGAEGFISVFQQNDPDHYELVASVPSAVGVRTRFFYAKRDRLYVGVPAKGSEPAQVWTFEAED